VKLLYNSLFFITLLFSLVLILPEKSQAVTYSCVGSYVCTKQNISCGLGCNEIICPASGNCPGGAPDGECCYSGTSSYSVPCSGLPLGTCSSSVGCPSPYYVDASTDTCTLQTVPGGCQSNADCGSNSQCCANPGNDNYCSNYCYDLQEITFVQSQLQLQPQLKRVTSLQLIVDLRV
jgi:hypothetical protein